MHFEILVEDISGKKTLDILIPKIIDTHNYKNTFNVIFYKGIGCIPKNLNPKADPQKRQLLSQLPRLVQGYGKTWNSSNYNGVLIIVCDLDKRCLKKFRQELLDCVNKCNSKPLTYFCIAIEEMEAWFLGDFSAIQKAYPKTKLQVLQTYKQDSICDTWEKLADAIFKGGYQKLSQQGGNAIGTEKSNWAEKITPYIDVDKNVSPSFRYFTEKLRQLSL